MSANTIFNIFINLTDGSTLTLDVQAEDTIKKIKQMICDKVYNNSHTDEIRLIYSGSQLEDHKTLATYNITDCSTICLIFRLIGGGIAFSGFSSSFSAPLLGEEIRYELDDKADDIPEYVCVFSGLNVKFNCCNYKDHQSTQWFKFGDFSYADLVNKFKCPKCKVKQLPCSLDFVNCIYKIQAVPVKSSDKSININETTGKNKSVRYPCEGNTLYKSFTIETYKLDE